MVIPLDIPSGSTLIRGRYFTKKEDDGMREMLCAAGSGVEKSSRIAEKADKTAKDLLQEFSPAEALEIIRAIQKQIKADYKTLPGWHMES